MKRIKNNNEGQTSLDFLIGVTIFVLAFVFVFAFIPGMFAPFYSNSDELTMTADRVATMLIDDTLAVNSSGTQLPGILSQARIQDFNDSLYAGGNSVASEKFRRGIGLNASNGLVYNLEIEINASGKQIKTFGDGETWGNANVGQSRRFVMIRDSTATGLDSYPGRMAVITVRVWQ